MKLKLYYFAIITLILYSCNKHTNHIDITYLSPEISIDCFNDSIYFSKIVSIENFNNEYFLVDVINHFILHIDSSFNLIQKIGNQGRGPGELLHPFNVFNFNNQIYISDAANRRINIYSNKETSKYEFINSINIKYFIQDNKSLLMLNDSCYCCSTPGEAGPIKLINLKKIENKYFGQFYNVIPKIERNSRMLTKDSTNIYSIAVSEPIIEKFNNNCELLNRTNLDENTFFKKTIKENKKTYKQYPKNTTAILFTDVSVKNDIIYLLVTERLSNGFAQSNKILAVEFSNKQYNITKIFDLGVGRFSSFCISNDLKKIIAFNEYIGEIQIYNFPN
jgi:hypothetical protein